MRNIELFIKVTVGAAQVAALDWEKPENSGAWLFLTQTKDKKYKEWLK
jgi:hypothetical protein